MASTCSNSKPQPLRKSHCVICLGYPNLIAKDVPWFSPQQHGRQSQSTWLPTHPVTVAIFTISWVTQLMLHLFDRKEPIPYYLYSNHRIYKILNTYKTTRCWALGNGSGRVGDTGHATGQQFPSFPPSGHRWQQSQQLKPPSSSWCMWCISWPGKGAAEWARGQYTHVSDCWRYYQPLLVWSPQCTSKTIKDPYGNSQNGLVDQKIIISNTMPFWGKWLIISFNWKEMERCWSRALQT